MNIEGQDTETYQIFVVPIGNAKITEEIEFQPRATVLKYKARGDLYYTEAPADSVSRSDNIEKGKGYFVTPSY